MECPACHTPNIDGARFCAKCGALLPAATEEADPLIGSVVGGRFRITGVLGEGGMGRVYTGEQQMGTSVRKVAVKTLLAQYAKDTQVHARFMRECGTVSELEHPNTIKVYDFGQTNTGELYIAMELLSGKTLETALEQGALAPERVDRILGQVCGSLQEAHDKGIVHRDLKPANIFLTTRAGEEDYVKVLDFGIAKKDDKNSKHEEKLTKQGTVLGTPPYMSPEQFKGQELDARSDIYSLAVLTYEMLTGRLPFDADNAWGWATAHLSVQPYPFESLPMGNAVPPKMKAAVMRALSKDKTQRQQSVRQFYEEFTMGAPRISALGGRSSLSDAVPSTGTAMMPSRPGTGSGPMMPSYPGTGANPAMASGAHTQLGEPVFTAPAQPAGRTMVDASTNPSYPGMAQPPGYPSPHVPTGSGQVMAPQPMAPAKKSGAGPIIGAVAGVAVVAIIAGVALTHKKDGGSAGLDAGIALPTAASVTVVGQDNGEDAGADKGTDAGAKTTTTTGATHTGTSTGTPTPPVDAKADAECKAAVGLATGGNTAMAVNHFRNCDGPGKAGARSAIDASAQRAAARGCQGVGDANAAASIGATSALNQLRSKKCPGVK